MRVAYLLNFVSNYPNVYLEFILIEEIANIHDAGNTILLKMFIWKIVCINSNVNWKYWTENNAITTIHKVWHNKARNVSTMKGYEVAIMNWQDASRLYHPRPACWTPNFCQVSAAISRGFKLIFSSPNMNGRQNDWYEFFFLIIWLCINCYIL